MSKVCFLLAIVSAAVLIREGEAAINCYVHTYRNETSFSTTGTVTSSCSNNACVKVVVAHSTSEGSIIRGCDDSSSGVLCNVPGKSLTSASLHTYCCYTDLCNSAVTMQQKLTTLPLLGLVAMTGYFYNN